MVNIQIKLIKTILLTAGIMFLLALTVAAQRTVIKSGVLESDFYGTVDSDRYVNEFFGLKFRIPKGYTVLENKQTKVYTDAGADVLKGTDANGSKRIDEAMAKQATIIGIAQKPMGSPGNAVIEIVVLKQAKGVTAKMALASSASLMTSSGKYKLVKSLDGKFGGQQLPGILLEGDFHTFKLTEQLYSIMRHGYSVFIGVTYSTNEGRENMLSVLNGLDFFN